MMRRLYAPLQAFTLSELLVSLGIIAVIAALTIPNMLSNVQSRQELATFREDFLLLESVLQRYCASPNYGTTAADGQFSGFFVANVRRVKARVVGTDTTPSSVTFTNDSKVTINPSTNTILVQWDADDTTNTVTLNFNPLRTNDVVIDGRNLKACELAPISSQRDLYIRALGLKADTATGSEYVGNTTQLINPSDMTVTQTTVDSGSTFDARDGGFS